MHRTDHFRSIFQVLLLHGLAGERKKSNQNGGFWSLVGNCDMCALHK